MNYEAEMKKIKSYISEKDSEKKQILLDEIVNYFIESTNVEYQLAYMDMVNSFQLSLYDVLKKKFIEKKAISEEKVKEICPMLEKYEHIDELFVFDMYKNAFGVDK